MKLSIAIDSSIINLVVGMFATFRWLIYLAFSQPQSKLIIGMRGGIITRCENKLLFIMVYHNTTFGSFIYLILICASTIKFLVNYYYTYHLKRWICGNKYRRLLSSVSLSFVGCKNFCLGSTTHSFIASTQALLFENKIHYQNNKYLN